MKRKLTGLFLASSLVAVTVTGCGSGTQSAGSDNNANTNTSSTNATDSSDQPVTISVLHYMVEKPKIDAFKKLTDAYTKLHPNVKFDVQVQPVGTQYDNALKMKLQTGDSPDLIFGRPQGEIDFVKNGTFLDLTNQPFMKNIDEKFYPNVTYDGKLYGMPVDLMTNGVLYNKDIFEKAGVQVPTTFSDFLKVCATLKAKGYTPFANAFKEGVSIFSFLWPDMNGSPLMKPNMADYQEQIMSGKKKFSDYPEFNGIMQRFSQLTDYSNPDYKDISYDTSLQYFASGKSAMDIMGSFAIGSIRADNPNGNFGVFMFPSYNNPNDNYMTFSTDDTWMVGAKSKHQKEALDFLNFMTSQQGAQIWADGVQTISTLKTPVTPAKEDPMAADFLKIYQGGKIVNNQLHEQWYGQYSTVFQQDVTKFAYEPSGKRDLNQLITELDNDFAKINQMK